MANLSDVINRTDRLLTKYEKYDANLSLQKRIATFDKKAKATDPFTAEWITILEEVQSLSLKGEEAKNEKNRAQKAALNAEVRRGKATLVQDALPRLEKLVRTKGSTTEDIQDRLSKIEEIQASIDTIFDGNATLRRPQRLMSAHGAGSSLQSAGEIHIDTSNLESQLASGKALYSHTEETLEFKNEWEVAKARQDERLEGIEKGIGTLKELGIAMGEEVQRQDVLIDEVDAKMDSVTADLRNNNAKLKGLVTKVRSSRNFFIDVILIIVLLALALYIYNIVK